MRRPAVAGQFYPGRKEGLMHLIKESFIGELGPGEVPKVPEKRTRKIVGAVVPHAGYVYSGQVAAHTYSEIVKDGFPSTFVIIGPNHTGLGTLISVSDEDFETPLGVVKNDVKLTKAVWKGIIDKDRESHEYEHSIEVQLPFLQYFGIEFKLTPIVMSGHSYESAREVGEIVADAIKSTGTDAVIIASSDLTHAGFRYGQTPPKGKSVKEFANMQDEKAMAAIEKFDAKGLIETVEDNNITMCGYGPVAAMLVASKALGANSVKRLKYATSNDIEPGPMCVGYSAFIVTK